MDFNQHPFIVIWETTNACDLACAHCRAQAQPDPLPGELTHEEGMALIDSIAQMGARILVLSGGDPLKRKDLTLLIRRGKEQGLRMGTIPAATPRLTREAVFSLKAAGLDQMALSLDASNAQQHDDFRGVEGAFAKTLEAARWAHEAQMPLQINSVMSRRNLDDLPRLIELVRRLGIVFWEVFFLVPTGRGSAVRGLNAQEYERVFVQLHAVASKERFILKVTEGLHYRRYVIERHLAAHGIDPRTLAWTDEGLPDALKTETGLHGSIGLSPQTVNAGKGHLFISSTGEVYPSGFLPLSAGNVRQAGLSQIYRTSLIFRQLRDPRLLKGRCGACEYRAVCGGSRARAYALTGDYLAEESCCAYIPLGIHAATAAAQGPRAL
jgi:radical SAM protein